MPGHGKLGGMSLLRPTVEEKESEGLLWPQGTVQSWGLSVGKVVLGAQAVEVIARVTVTIYPRESAFLKRP